MQAIVETLFDAFYLVSVITIGILMIRNSKGNAQFRLFGLMAVVLGAGDSFATAFLLAMLEKKDIHAAMEAGAEFAAKTCLVNGAFGHGIAFQEE